MEIVECAAFRVTRDADFAVSDEADDLLEAVELQLRRRRFGDSVRVEVADSMSEAMQERLLSGLGADSQQFYPVTGLLDLADTMELARLDRPDLKDDPWLPVTQPRLAELDAPGRVLRRDQAERPPRPPPLRIVRDQLRGVRPRRRRRSQRRRTEDHRLSHERRDAARPGAHRGVRGREAERLPGRAQGSVRRAPQHRVVAGARALGRARRLWVPAPEDPREGDARGPAGRRRAEALRPRRNRELPHDERSQLRGFRPLHRGPGDRRGRRRPLQLPDRVRAAPAVPQAARRAVDASLAADRRDPRRRRGRARPARRAGSGSR